MFYSINGREQGLYRSTEGVRNNPDGQQKISVTKASLDGGIEHTHVCGGRVIVTDGVELCRPRSLSDLTIPD